jgi:cytochrome c peroxidase
MLYVFLRVLSSTLFLLFLAATVGIPSGRRGPVAAEANRAEPLLGLDLYRPVPDDNPLTAEKVALGRRLFRERLLSRDRTLSYVGCHDPERAFTNGKRVAEGAYGRAGRRNVPALFNRAWGRSFFWDGRAATLEAQAVQPITSPLEMDMTMQEVVERLGREPEYAAAFRRAFGRDIQEEDPARALERGGP